MVSHRHCGSGDTIFLVAEGQDSTCPRFNLSLLFISKAHGMPYALTHEISGHDTNN